MSSRGRWKSIQKKGESTLTDRKPQPREVPMSTTFAPHHPIRFDEIFDGRLMHYNLFENTSKAEGPDWRVLTDGRGNYLTAIRTKTGNAIFSRADWTNCGAIVETLAKAFNMPIYSEYEPQFLG